MKILITGGCGFIGLNLVEYLLKKTEWNINIIDNLSAGKKENLEKINNFSHKRVQFIEGDMRNKRKIDAIIRDCDNVVHLAAQTGVIPSIKEPLKDAEINIMGTLNVLHAAVEEGIEKVVYASSAAPLGETSPPLNEKKVPQPLSPYGASKLACEGYCSAYAHSFNLHTVALRFSNAYGPYSYHKQSVVATLLKQILNKERITIYGTGNQTRDFIHAYDVSKAIYLAITTDLSDKFELFQIATGKETTVNTLYEIIKKEMETHGFSVMKPRYTNPREGEMYRNYADIGKAKKLLDYKPSVSLNLGIKGTVRWFIQHT